MEISEKEYYELKEQIQRLQLRVEGINTPPKDLRSRVEEHPINHVRNVVNDAPIFDYSSQFTGDAWVLFVRLAKIIHRPSDKFYMDTTRARGYGEPYIRSYRSGDAPRKITEMSEEQVQISVEMLNELIPIYNKYFRMTHQTVLYSDEGNGIYRHVNVCQPDEE